MAVTVLLQKNSSEKICLTKNTTTILEISAVFKEETSLIDPSFIIETDIATISEVNYITVADFRRSYFVLNMVSITNNLVELNCHVDVLSSFASEIKANTGIVYRQENNWNLYLNDGVIKAYQNPIVTTQAFPKGFTEQNYVLVCAGSRNIGGVVIGGGGSIDTTFPEEAGTGNITSKTTSGLVNYCKAQIGNPYWFGTFGNIANAELLTNRRRDYSAYYPDPGSPAFTDQFGQRVHDCVGLIKGYRWSDTPTSTPQYVADEDVDVRGLWSQCNRMRGNVDFSHTETAHLIGMCVFDSALTHVGVYVGNGKIIEAQGHAYGVVENLAYDRRGKFTLWGVPDWLKITTSYFDSYLPIIDVQPTDQYGELYTTAHFTIVATSYVGTLTYKWEYYNNDTQEWSDITAPSARTADYSFMIESRHDNRRYRCLLSNPYGTVISNEVVLHITT